MSKFIQNITGILFLLSCLVLFAMQAFAYQPQWNVVMFGLSWSQNLTLIEASQSRTGMLDLNTGLRVSLPFRYQSPINGGVSEDRSRILGVVDAAEGGGGGDLVMFYQSRNGQQRFLTTHPGYDAEPDAVDDLRRIVFISNRDGTFDIYVLMFDEGDDPKLLRRLTADEDVERAPQWLTREQYRDYLDRWQSGSTVIVIDEEATAARNALRRGTRTSQP